VLSAKRPGPFLRPKRIGSEPDCGGDPENEKRWFGESPISHDEPFIGSYRRL
jgi:hypothetical protein